MDEYSGKRKKLSGLKSYLLRVIIIGLNKWKICKGNIKPMD